MDKLFKYIEPKIAIDIGANVGDFSKELYYRFPNCEIVMVEANPNCEKYLRVLELPHEIIALSDKEETKDFYVEKTNSTATGASFYIENTEWYSEGKYETVKTKTFTLDSRNYFKQRNVDLIKIDVQGSELDVLIGGEKTIKRTNFVLLELSLTEYNKSAPGIQKVVDKMIEFGFYIIDILEYHSFSNLYNGQIFQIDALFKNRNIY